MDGKRTVTATYCKSLGTELQEIVKERVSEQVRQKGQPKEGARLLPFGRNMVFVTVRAKVRAKVRRSLSEVSACGASTPRPPATPSRRWQRGSLVSKQAPRSPKRRRLVSKQAPPQTGTPAVAGENADSSAPPLGVGVGVGVGQNQEEQNEENDDEALVQALEEALCVGAPRPTGVEEGALSCRKARRATKVTRQKPVSQSPAHQIPEVHILIAHKKRDNRVLLQSGYGSLIGSTQIGCPVKCL